MMFSRRKVIRFLKRKSISVKESILGSPLIENFQTMSLKSKSIKKDCIELNYEIRLKDQETSFVNELSDMEGVLYTVMVSYNGDYMN